MIYIINSILFKGSIDIEGFLNEIPAADYSYEREMTIKNIDDEFIDKLNNDNYGGEKVINDIVLEFNENMEIKAKVSLNKLLDINETKQLKSNIAEIFKINEQNIEIGLW